MCPHTDTDKDAIARCPTGLSTASHQSQASAKGNTATNLSSVSGCVRGYFHMCARGACLVYSLIGTLMCTLGRDKVGGEEY